MTLTGVFHMIMLLGIIQGLILCVLLFISSKRFRPNRFLAGVMLLFALACLNLFLDESSTPPLLSFLLNFIPLNLAMLIGPMIYLYIRSSVDPTFEPGKKIRWHFVPVIIDIVPKLTTVIYVAGLLLNLIPNHPQPWGKFIDDYNVYSDIPRWLSITGYLLLSYRCLRTIPNIAGQKQKWFRQFISIFLIFQGIWLLYLIPYIIPSLTDTVLNNVDWYPVYIPLVALIYCLGIKGYMIPPPAEPIKKTTTPPATDVINTAIPLLIKAMEQDKIYLDPDLNLTILSQHTGLAAKTISAVLNQHMQKSFNEYINQYRIETFKQKIQEPGADKITILGLAFESGFNSQATFQRAFRQNTGMSPREYITEQLKNTG
ncbi:MAG TPA: helix-turn-helix domain-containing protein [Chitinophaga sp.]|uniref:AraC family transcriptional regulator n=1 Tax=Chitinophaga sp. TaxID=1869181 RepID=UPI002C18BA4A|nr:helix-turn-helix domain-containing protein [Chitinophaga sp.]HVI46109.1 helix-turn-helix domain-containing protein [Chitinophaga sp.]